jgi:hypothetical protein
MLYAPSALVIGSYGAILAAFVDSVKCLDPGSCRRSAPSESVIPMRSSPALGMVSAPTQIPAL